VREVDRVADLLAQTYHGDAVGLAWFGPALRPLLGTISPATATHRPLPRRHTIWELVLHLAANIDFVLARLDGTELELSANADWPPVREPTIAAWKDALDALDARYETLLERVGGLSDAQLAQPVVGRRYDAYAMLHGIIHHNVYHTGQIALLRDVSDSRTA
jgi:uncharacterized damage-inducible protein DinB